MKKWIRENSANIEVAPSTSCQMKCQGLELDDILYCISDEGDSDILFEESQTKGYPKTYIIQSSRGDSIDYKFGFILKKDSSSVVSMAQRLDKTFECDCK